MLATKVHNMMHDGPGGSGRSRKAILEQVDASLRRLDTDYIDLPTSRSRRRWRRCTTSQPVVTAPIVGATKPHHLADAAASHHVQLTEDEVRRLEEPYTTQPAYYCGSSAYSECARGRS